MDMARRRFRFDPSLGRLVEIIAFDDERRAPDVMGDLPAYESPIDGRVIEGRAARREDLKRNQCRPYEEGERQAMEQRRAAEDRALERSVDRTVEKFFYEQSSRGRELLAEALRAGAGVQYLRR